MSINLSKLFKSVTVLSILAIALAACGSKPAPDTNPGQAPSGTNTTANDLEKIKKAGKIKIGLMGTYAPYNFLNDKHEVDGFDADVSKAVAKHLALKSNSSPVNFPV